jgi:hypothetical protein
MERFSIHFSMGLGDIKFFIKFCFIPKLHHSREDSESLVMLDEVIIAL